MGGWNYRTPLIFISSVSENALRQISFRRVGNDRPDVLTRTKLFRDLHRGTHVRSATGSRHHAFLSRELAHGANASGSLTAMIWSANFASKVSA